jgi:hypothetical protein
MRNKEGIVMRHDFQNIARLAIPYALPIVRRLLPGGQVRGQEYVVRNPRRADRHPGSFSVNLHTGRWADFALGSTARGGDLIALFAYVENCSQAEAFIALRRMLGR